jgi:glycosyltransferase involved in cell wall biosynthesis
MKIAYLVNQYPKTSHTFIRREIQALEAEGVEVARFSLRRVAEELVTDADRVEQARTRVLLDAGSLLILLAVARAAVTRPVRFARALRAALAMGWRSDRGVLRHLAYLAEACLLQRWLLAAGASHVHAHFGTNPAAVALLCRELGGPPYSFTIHGPEEFDKPEFLALREKTRRAAFVAVVSHFGRSQLWRWARPEDWHKVDVIRCGLDTELIAAPRPPAVPRVPRLVCVARLSEQKGHLLLIDAAARLARGGVAFELVLAGDGPMRSAVEEAIARAGLGDRVRITGWLSAARVRDEILAARALVLPSFAEGLPVVAMEALALARPVITTAIAGTPELVEPGVTGWLVPAGSAAALVGAMREALEASPERLDEMGRAGAALVARQHDARHEARKLAELFRASAGAPPVARTPAGAERIAR